MITSLFQHYRPKGDIGWAHNATRGSFSLQPESRYARQDGGYRKAQVRIQTDSPQNGLSTTQARTGLVCVERAFVDQVGLEHKVCRRVTARLYQLPSRIPPPNRQAISLAIFKIGDAADLRPDILPIEEFCFQISSDDKARIFIGVQDQFARNQIAVDKRALSVMT